MASGTIPQGMGGFKPFMHTGTIPSGGTAYRQTVGSGMGDAHLVDFQYYHTQNNAWYGVSDTAFSSAPIVQITGGNICELRFTVPTGSDMAGRDFRALILWR